MKRNKKKANRNRKPGLVIKEHVLREITTEELEDVAVAGGRADDTPTVVSN